MASAAALTYFFGYQFKDLSSRSIRTYHCPSLSNTCFQSRCVHRGAEAGCSSLKVVYVVNLPENFCFIVTFRDGVPNIHRRGPHQRHCHEKRQDSSYKHNDGVTGSNVFHSESGTNMARVVALYAGQVRHSSTGGVQPHRCQTCAFWVVQDPP
jgi:hypothetical protein